MASENSTEKKEKQGIGELEGLTLEQLDKLIEQSQQRTEKLRATQDPSFGLPPDTDAEEAVRITDKEVEDAIGEAQRAVKISKLVGEEVAQRNLLLELRQKSLARLRTSKAALTGRPAVRQPTREAQGMYPANKPCAQCGKKDYEVPFPPDPDPNRPLYCQDCMAERRSGSQQRGGQDRRWREEGRRSPERRGKPSEGGRPKQT